MTLYYVEFKLFLCKYMQASILLFFILKNTICEWDWMQYYILKNTICEWDWMQYYIQI